MKVLLSWVKDSIDIDCSIDELTERLTHVGLNLEELIELDDDVILDLEVTSNRPDCLAHIGIAREISASLGKPLKTPQIELAGGSGW